MTPETKADIATLTETLTRIASDLLEGRGFAVPVFTVVGAVNAGKRLAGQEGAGKQVMSDLFATLMRDHPEVIDLAFAGMSEITKNKIRQAVGTPPIKDAERA
jgi:Asp/Glu/hydantoin racemase